MIKEVIKNCPVTLSDSTMLMPFIDTKSNIWYNRNGGYHTGIDLSGTDAYAICDCVVTYVGCNSDEHHVVIVQYDRETSFRYTNLTSVSVTKGSTVASETHIGRCNKYVHFEYLNRTPSTWKVRSGNESYYKHDPISYVRGEVTFTNGSKTVQYFDIYPQIQTLF